MVPYSEVDVRFYKVKTQINISVKSSGSLAPKRGNYRTRREEEKG